MLKASCGTKKNLSQRHLALVLFTDAANANLTVLKSTVRLPCSLLLVGLPLTILVGFGVGRLLFPDFSLLEAAILATMLAPTDAALGKAVVSNPQVPMALLAFATNQNTEGSTSQLLLHLFTEEIGIGVLVGASLVVLGIQLAKFAIERNWLSETWQQASVPTLAIALIIVATPKMNNL